ncbi:MAG: acetoacetate--CoA ligase [Saprospiraceae bacterium]|nr:acetoacetate--CoA ligase [Saprospiraceae bacterium]
MDTNNQILWQPTDYFKENSNLQHYIHWVSENYGQQFVNYQDIWQWSVDNIETFWQSLFSYFDIQFSGTYSKVLSDEVMPRCKWFEGVNLNYAEHIFRQKNTNAPAIIFQAEHLPMQQISWATLEKQTAALASYLKSIGVQKGDCVVGYLPTIPESTIAFLATCSIGAIWSSCSPDFGASSVIDRFKQIQPKVLIAANGYSYNGKIHRRENVVDVLAKEINSIEKTILIDFVERQQTDNQYVSYKNLLNDFSDTTLTFERVPFNDPIWVLFSSGTTGLPKAITHSQGGVLLEHLKYLTFHNDVKKGERFYWYTTTGWMMWNFVNAALLIGATTVLYEGSPGYPNLNVLWQFCEDAKINHFGTSAPFLVACMKEQIKINQQFKLRELRSIGSTGSPLPPEAFDYVYEHIKKDLWLCSMSGGTDVCSAFVGGCPLEPVYEGEIQCRAMGCSMFSFNEKGEPIMDEVGEMVVTKPMPSMPIYFWGDTNFEKYRESYFDVFPNVWRHGDWLKITPHYSLIILGRSDATLNRQGVRIGTAEIYNSVNKIAQIKDSLIVNLELQGGQHFMPLFVVLKDNITLTDDLKRAVNQQLRQDYSPRHVPDEIIAVADIPYTISGKKMEAPVKKILMGMDVTKLLNKDALRNPESLQFFMDFAKSIEI